MEVIWWNFFQIFVFILGGPGEAYVESRGTKVSVMKTSSHWIHMHNKEKQWIISLTYMWKHIYICGYMGAGGGGGGGEGFQ